MGGRAYGTAQLLNNGSTIAGQLVVVAIESNNAFYLQFRNDDGSYGDLDQTVVDAAWYLGFQLTYFT